MEMYYKKAKSISFSKSERDRNSILYIVFHYTGNKGDTAKNNVDFYANGNTREAGAHFFVDQAGRIGRSIPMNRTAWSIGGAKYNKGGTCYGRVTNDNSISIEMCDIVNKLPSDEMIGAIKELLTYIQKYCPNATTVVRHYDVTGKYCPASMIDTDTWEDFLESIGCTLVGKKF